MLASIFIIQGYDTFRNPERVAAKAEPVVRPVAERVPVVPAKAEQAVRLNGAVQMVAGSLLALGRFPRLSALVIGGSLVPTTLAGHRFWEAEDDASKAQQRIHFLKNLSMLGGLLIAAVDTEGKPSLVWRARYAAKSAGKSAAVPAKTARTSVAAARKEAARTTRTAKREAARAALMARREAARKARTARQEAALAVWTAKVAGKAGAKAGKAWAKVSKAGAKAARPGAKAGKARAKAARPGAKLGKARAKAARPGTKVGKARAKAARPGTKAGKLAARVSH